MLTQTEKYAYPFDSRRGFGYLGSMVRPTFPRTLREFRERFANEEACFEYLAQSRWPEGFRCTQCGMHEFWIKSRRHSYECKACGRQTSPTAGTVLHGTRIPIQEWFWAAYLVTTHTPGLSAKQLERQIGCRYQTAWFLLHRLRRAMVNEVRSKLRGFVEADETIVGGPVRGKRGRAVTDLATKTLVLGAVEVIDYTDKRGEDAQKAGRIRLATTPRADGQSIKQFLAQNVEKRSSIRTDGWRGYSKSALSAYNHDQTPGMRASHIHRAFGNLKTWLNGTHHGVNPKYLQNYLDEFVFRFNRRKTPMAAFQTLLGLTSARSPIHYEELIQREPTG